MVTLSCQYLSDMDTPCLYVCGVNYLDERTWYVVLFVWFKRYCKLKKRRDPALTALTELEEQQRQLLKCRRSEVDIFRCSKLSKMIMGNVSRNDQHGLVWLGWEGLSMVSKRSQR